MLTFEQFLFDGATKGEAVNILFEQRLFELVGILHKIATPLAAEGIPYELIGGLITSDVGQTLPDELRSRLQHVRQTE